jgi:hypothetical protein
MTLCCPTKTPGIHSQFSPSQALSFIQRHIEEREKHDVYHGVGEMVRPAEDSATEKSN